MLLAWGSPTVLPHWNGIADSRPNSLLWCYPAWLPSCLEHCRCRLTSGYWEWVVKGDDTALLADHSLKINCNCSYYPFMVTVKLLSYRAELHCTVKVKHKDYVIHVLLCHSAQQAGELCFYWPNRYYTGIISLKGTSYGRIWSSRSFRFAAHTTITHNKQTSLTWKPMLHSRL